MELKGKKITVKVEGREAVLDLSGLDVMTGYSICEKGGLSEISVMKKEKGSALFFTNENNATNAQQRHNFEYMFTVEAKVLKPIALENLKTIENAKANEKK